MEKYNYAPIEIPSEVKQGMQFFSETNWERCTELFGGANFPDTYFTTAIAEEVGEVCGIIKKLKRGFNERELLKMRNKYSKENKDLPAEFIPGADFFNSEWHKTKTESLAGEIADVFIYLDLLAHKHGINIMEAVEDKYNQVTLEMKPQE